MNKILNKISLLAVITGAAIVFPQTAIALTPPLLIHPNTGPVGTYFTVDSTDTGNFGSDFWFSSGNYSTFLNPVTVNANSLTFKVPSSVCPGVETDSCSSNFSVPTPAGFYSVYMKSFDGDGNPQTHNFGFFTVTSATGAHPQGTNILAPDGTVYRIDFGGNSRSPYTSAGAYLSYKFNSWATTVPANPADLSLPLTTYTVGGDEVVVAYIQPRSGSLINDHGTVYLITAGGRAGFTTEAVFRGLGFSFSNVYPGDTSFMRINYEPINSTNLKHADGVLINDNGTLYVMKNGYRMGFPNLEVLDSWGYWVTDAVSANSLDRAAASSGVMQMRLENQLNI